MPNFVEDERKRQEQQADKIQRCLRSEEGKFLVSWLNEQLYRDQTQLEGASELIEIGRWQGRVETLRKILKLKEE